MKSPLVSVIMPVYNSERYLREAIESILNQTFQDFEFLIFDDGSDDSSKEIINEYADRDDRIIPFYSDSNCGYVVHLNKGIEIAKGEFIARMDSDDISLPDRFEKQVDFLKSNPDVGVCGSRVEVIYKDGSHVQFSRHLLNDKDLKVRLIENSCFSHPSVIIRKSVLAKANLSYKEMYLPAEDFLMWYEISKHSKLANLPRVLLKYRMHSEQITVGKKEKQKKVTCQIRRKIIEDLITRPLSLSEMELHNSLLTHNFIVSKQYVMDAERWFYHLINVNKAKKIYDFKSFEALLGSTWFLLCTNSCNLGYWIIFKYLKGELKAKLTVTLLVKFVIKSALKYSPK